MDAVAETCCTGRLQFAFSVLQLAAVLSLGQNKRRHNFARSWNPSIGVKSRISLILEQRRHWVTTSRQTERGTTPSRERHSSSQEWPDVLQAYLRTTSNVIDHGNHGKHLTYRQVQDTTSLTCIISSCFLPCKMGKNPVFLWETSTFGVSIITHSGETKKLTSRLSRDYFWRLSAFLSFTKDAFAGLPCFHEHKGPWNCLLCRALFDSEWTFWLHVVAAKPAEQFLFCIPWFQKNRVVHQHKWLTGIAFSASCAVKPRIFRWMTIANTIDPAASICITKQCGVKKWAVFISADVFHFKNCARIPM